MQTSLFILVLHKIPHSHSIPSLLRRTSAPFVSSPHMTLPSTPISLLLLPQLAITPIQPVLVCAPPLLSIPHPMQRISPHKSSPSTTIPSLLLPPLAFPPLFSSSL